MSETLNENHEYNENLTLSNGDDVPKTDNKKGLIKDKIKQVFLIKSSLAKLFGQ